MVGSLYGSQAPYQQLSSGFEHTWSIETPSSQKPIIFIHGYELSLTLYFACGLPQPSLQVPTP